MAAVLLRMAGADALEDDAEPQPPDRQLREIVEPVRAGEGQAVVGADGKRQSAFGKHPREGIEDAAFTGRLEGLAAQEIARCLVGDRQGVTISAVAQLELALEVGAPQIVGAADSAVPMALFARFLLRAWLTRPYRSSTACTVLLAGMRTSPARRRTRSSRILRAPSAASPGCNERSSPGPVRQGLQPVLLAAIEDLVAGLARDPERPTHLAHTFALQQTGDKSKTLIHDRSLSPRHPHLPTKIEKCNPCLRYGLSPISQVGHYAFSSVDFPINLGCGSFSVAYPCAAWVCAVVIIVA